MMAYRFRIEEASAQIIPRLTDFISCRDFFAQQ
jgi:hypothetical protein